MNQKERTFENFITTANRLAQLAAEEVCRFPGQKYNPLYFYGEHGVGKTHMLNTIANSYSEKCTNVIYISASQIAEELIEAVKNGEITEFRKRYQDSDVLLIDDFQYLVGKDATQEEILDIIDVLLHKGKQIVIASDSSLDGMSKLSDGLCDELARGLCIELCMPDFGNRVAIVKQKLQNLGIYWPEEAYKYVALKTGASINQIEGEINKILLCKTLI